MKKILLLLLALSAACGAQAQKYASEGQVTVGLGVAPQAIGALSVAPISSPYGVTLCGIGNIAALPGQTGIAAVEAARPDVEAEAGRIVVRHKADGAQVRIYTADGRRVYTGTSASVRVGPGLYLVRMGAQCVKVVVD